MCTCIFMHVTIVYNIQPENLAKNKPCGLISPAVKVKAYRFKFDRMAKQKIVKSNHTQH